MRVSIALCVYNAAAYLQEQLDSYLAQTRLPDELVIGDDCSSDETITILEKFAECAPFPVRIHVNEQNLKVTRNFGETVSRCTGDVIFLSDADDVWMPTKIEKITAEFEKYPQVGLVFANAELVDEHLAPLNATLWDQRFPAEKQAEARAGRFIEVLVDKNVIGGATAAVRAEFKKYFLPIPGHFSALHDGWIGLMIASMGEIHFLPDLLIKYRQHSQQTSRIIWGKRGDAADRREICEEGVRFYREKERDLAYFFDTVKKFDFPELKNNAIFRKGLPTLEKELEKLRAAIEHFENRRDLPAGVGRFLKVGKEALTGRYWKYSNGLSSVVKDLIYP